MIRTIFFAVLVLVLANPARSATFVYVSVAAEKRIAVYQLDAATGNLTHKSDCQVSDGEPGALTVDPDRLFLLAALRSTGKLASFRLDAATGKLTHINTVSVGPDPAHVSTDRTGRYLLTAYYVDARVTVHAIGKDGALSEQPIQSIPTADKAHAIVPDPSNRFVFVPHTGPNAIFQFTFDAGMGRLSANSPAKLLTPGNTGPRHLAFHPSKPIAYVDNEQGSGITSYTLDDKAGTLSALQTLSTLPADFKGTNACAEIKVHPAGRFAYVSNRGHDSLAAFAIAADGKLSALRQFSTEKTPRSFDIDPAGNYLFAAGESSGKLAGYRINSTSGALTRLATYDVGNKPWWVMAVEVPRPIRVLFVGNSQFYYSHMPKIVEVLAASAPQERPRIVADWRPSDRSVAGGATLERHWKFGTDKNTARAKITEETWDYVILQEFVGYAAKESTNQYARLFHDLIRQKGAKTVLFSTAHVASKVPKGFLEIDEVNGTLGKELEVPVVRAGMAWMAYWGANPTQEQILALYDRDKGHPGPKGSYLYACSLYAFLTDQSPVGLTNRVPHLPEHPISPDEAKGLQEAAWRVHQEGKTKAKR